MIDDLMEKYSAQQGWSTQSKLDICLAYIEAQQSHEAFENHLLEQVDNENDNDVRQYYDNEECPDCGEDIPLGTQAGEDCVNCGHVFWKPKQHKSV